MLRQEIVGLGQLWGLAQGGVREVDQLHLQGVGLSGEARGLIFAVPEGAFVLGPGAGRDVLSQGLGLNGQLRGAGSALLDGGPAVLGFSDELQRALPFASAVKPREHLLGELSGVLVAVLGVAGQGALGDGGQLLGHGGVMKAREV